MFDILQITFLNAFLCKYFLYWLKFTDFFFWIDKKISFGFVDGVVQNRQQAITWASGDGDHWCHMVSTMN